MGIESGLSTSVRKRGMFRENNYDLLRVVAMLMVILNHVSDFYLTRTDVSSGISIYLSEGVAHLAVPCFLMLTGAFVIDKVRGKDIGEFYKKSFKKLVVPVIIIAPVYWLAMAVYGKLTLGFIYMDLKLGFMRNFPHWYMAMIVGIYALLPLIGIIKDKLSPKAYMRFAILYFLWAMVSKQLDTYLASYTIGCSLGFMGFVLLGDVIKSKVEKNNITGAICILAGLGLLMFDYYLLYGSVLDGGVYHDKRFSDYSAPLAWMSTVLIFIGFSMLKIKCSFAFLAKYSFFVYLTHKLVLDMLHYLMYKWLGMAMPMNYMPTMIGEVIIVLILALAVSIIFDKVLRYLLPSKKRLGATV